MEKTQLQLMQVTVLKNITELSFVIPGDEDAVLKKKITLHKWDTDLGDYDTNTVDEEYANHVNASLDAVFGVDYDNLASLEEGETFELYLTDDFDILLSKPNFIKGDAIPEDLEGEFYDAQILDIKSKKEGIEILVSGPEGSELEFKTAYKYTALNKETGKYEILAKKRKKQRDKFLKESGLTDIEDYASLIGTSVMVEVKVFKDGKNKRPFITIKKYN